MNAFSSAGKAAAEVILFERLRRRRALGVYLFVALALAASAERRLSETYFNSAAAGPLLESEDSVTGDEIKVRLIALRDGDTPTVPSGAERYTDDASCPADHLVSRPTGAEAFPRAPPWGVFS